MGSSMSSKVEYIEVDTLGGYPEPATDFIADDTSTEPTHDTPAAARKLNKYCRKIDTRILIYAIVLCVLNQSDRGSIGVAKVVGLEKDLGMVNNDFNIATTLFTVGYLSLEMFSNFLLKRIGASRLLPTLGILWGIVCALQGVIKTKTQLYVMRLLLGMAECGFTAGILLILSFFYPKSKLTTRVGFFYLSSPLSNVFSGPLASALSHIDHPTIKHWQWVFILEGLITVVVAFFGYYIFQDHPEKCSFLSDDEKEFIVAYKRREGTLGGSEQLSMRDTKRTLFDWQLWCMTVANFAVCAGCVTVSVFAPEVINELGFSATEAQAMSALPSACGAIAILLAGQIVKLCRSHWLAGSLSIGVALVGSIIMVATLSVPMRVFGLCLVGTGSFAGLGILPGWIITANSQTVANSAVASGLTVFMGASASFVTSNVFLNWDAPRFVFGHSVNIVLFLVGILACVVTRISMGRRNRNFESQRQMVMGNGGGSNRGFYFVY